MMTNKRENEMKLGYKQPENNKDKRNGRVVTVLNVN